MVKLRKTPSPDKTESLKGILSWLDMLCDCRVDLEVVRGAFSLLHCFVPNSGISSLRPGIVMVLKESREIVSFPSVGIGQHRHGLDNSGRSFIEVLNNLKGQKMDQLHALRVT